MATASNSSGVHSAADPAPFDEKLVATFVGIEEEAAAILQAHIVAPDPPVELPSWRDAARHAFESALPPRGETSEIAPPVDEADAAAQPELVAPVCGDDDAQPPAVVHVASSGSMTSTPAPGQRGSSFVASVMKLFACGCSSSAAVSAEVPTRVAAPPPLQAEEPAAVPAGENDTLREDDIVMLVEPEATVAAAVVGPDVGGEEARDSRDSGATMDPDHGDADVQIADERMEGESERSGEQESCDAADVTIRSTPSGTVSRLMTIMEADESQEEDVSAIAREEGAGVPCQPSEHVTPPTAEEDNPPAIQQPMIPLEDTVVDAAPGAGAVADEAARSAASAPDATSGVAVGSSGETASPDSQLALTSEQATLPPPGRTPARTLMQRLACSCISASAASEGAPTQPPLPSVMPSTGDIAVAEEAATSGDSTSPPLEASVPASEVMPVSTEASPPAGETLTPTPVTEGGEEAATSEASSSTVDDQGREQSNDQAAPLSADDDKVPAAPELEATATAAMPTTGVPATNVTCPQPVTMRQRFFAVIQQLTKPVPSPRKTESRNIDIVSVTKDKLSLRARVATWSWQADAQHRTVAISAHGSNKGASVAGSTFADTDTEVELRALRQRGGTNAAEEMALFAQEMHLREAVALLARLQAPDDDTSVAVPASIATALADAYVDVIIRMHDADLRAVSEGASIEAAMIDVAQAASYPSNKSVATLSIEIQELLARMISLADSCALVEIVRPLQRARDASAVAMCASVEERDTLNATVSELDAFLSHTAATQNQSLRSCAQALQHDAATDSSSLLKLTQMACDAAACTTATISRLQRDMLALRQQMHTTLLQPLISLTLKTLPLQESTLLWVPLLEGVDAASLENEATVTSTLQAAHASALRQLNTVECQVARLLLVRQCTAATVVADTQALVARGACVASFAVLHLSSPAAARAWMHAVDPIPKVSPLAQAALREPPPHARWENGKAHTSYVSPAAKAAAQAHIRAIAEVQRKTAAARAMEPYVMTPVTTSAAAHALWLQAADADMPSVSKECGPPIELSVLQHMYTLPRATVKEDEAGDSARKRTPMQRVASLLCSCRTCNACVDSMLSTERVTAQYRGVLRFGASAPSPDAGASAESHTLQYDQSTVWMDLIMLPLRARPHAFTARAWLAFVHALQSVMQTCSVQHEMHQLRYDPQPPSDARLMTVLETVLNTLGQQLESTTMPSPRSPSRTVAQLRADQRWQQLTASFSRDVIHRVLTYDAGHEGGYSAWLPATVTAIAALPPVKRIAPAPPIVNAMPPIPMTPARVKRMREAAALLPMSPREDSIPSSPPPYTPVSLIRLQDDAVPPVREDDRVTTTDVTSIDVRSITCSSPAVALLLRWVLAVRAFQASMMAMQRELDVELKERKQFAAATESPSVVGGK